VVIVVVVVVVVVVLVVIVVVVLVVVVVVGFVSVFLSRNVEHISEIQITVYSVVSYWCKTWSIGTWEGY
jgi:hypothetical protein